jgi:hypothetical protein
MKSKDIVIRIDKFVTALDSSSYSLPDRKFIREFLAGMLASRSPLLTDICRQAAGCKKKFKSTYQRIWRRSNQVDFAPAKLQQQNRALFEIRDHTVIAVDIGDIAKPDSKTLEGLAKVLDGSKSHGIVSGFSLIGAVAIDPTGEDKTPQPLELRLYSSVSGDFISENTEVNELIADIYHRTKGKGVFAIDRGADRIKIIEPLCDLRAKFVIRLRDRILLDAIENTSFRLKNSDGIRDELPHEATLVRRHQNGKRVPMQLKFDYKEVKIPSLKTHPQKLFMVTAWCLGKSRPMQLLTSLSVESPESAMKVVINYMCRWSIEETYRFLKTGNNLEKIQVRSLGKLKNIVNAAFIAASITARMARDYSWQKLFERIAQRQKKAPEILFNWLYLAADVIANVLSRNFKIIRKLNESKTATTRKLTSEDGLFAAEFST